MDGYRPVRARLGLLPAGMAGDVDVEDAGVADTPLSVYSHPSLSECVGRRRGLSSVALDGPVRPPLERASAPDRGGGISPVTLPEAWPSLPKAPPGDGLSDTGGVWANDWADGEPGSSAQTREKSAGREKG